MSPFLSRLHDGLRNCGLRRMRVLAAVSGGADSVAMLRGLVELQAECELTLAVGHFDHRLRGEKSAADARWVADLCARLGIPCHAGAAETSASGRRDEAAARRLRYAFLEETAAREGYAAITTAHTADDQAETVLHHILRGTGLTGLRGIPARRRLRSGVEIARPMLAVPRDAARLYLDEIEQDFRHDATNDDRRYTRNRIRHDLLPLLREQFNPQVDAALARLARQAADVEDALDQLAASLLERAVLDRAPGTCRVDCAPLADQPPALVRAALARIWTDLGWPRRDMGFEEWSALAELVQTPGRLTLPGAVDAESRDRLLILRRRPL